MANPRNVGGRVPLVLLLLRLSIFLVLLMWTLDKFFNPGHTSAIFQAFYGVGGVGPGLVYLIAIAQLILILAFVAGYKKPITYGAVLIIHGLSTLVSFRQYLDPFTTPNLLFFAAWPMLAGCFGLYYLRDLDTLWTVEQARKGL
jgi:putative oxidoreductase